MAWRERRRGDEMNADAGRTDFQRLRWPDFVGTYTTYPENNGLGRGSRYW